MIDDAGRGGECIPVCRLARCRIGQILAEEEDYASARKIECIAFLSQLQRLEKAL
jgi:hypothetical protein